MEKKIVVALGLMLMLSGCAGLGFDKSATLMPDEVWIAGDLNPNEGEHVMGMHVGEVTGGCKWKLK